MFLVVLAILSTILALTGPLELVIRSTALTWLAIGVATIVPPLLGRLVARGAIRRLDQHPDDPNIGQYFFARWGGMAQFVLGALHAGILVGTPWLTMCRDAPAIGHWPAVASLLAVVPFLLTVTLYWTAIYPADRAVRQIAVEVFLFRSRPVQPVWTLPQFLEFNWRHQVLFILLPMLLILVVRDILEWYDDDWRRRLGFGSLPDLILGAAAVLVAIFAPLLIRYTWMTQRLPDGPLRDKLTRLAAKLRVGCRDVLVWHSGGMIVNAAVMGIFAPLRYVLLSDAMLSQMDDTKIEAVFGHEAGHVKRHHILYFLLFALISGCLLTVFQIRTRGWAPMPYQIAAGAVTAVLAVKWGILFFWLSRKFERQADLFGARALTASGVPCQQPCMLHGLTDDTGVETRETRQHNPGPLDNNGAVCATAAHIFSDTLNDVAILNGIAPDSASLRHGSIASRSRFLQALAANPDAIVRFERTVAVAKAMVLVTALASALWAASEMKLWVLTLKVWDQIAT